MDGQGQKEGITRKRIGYWQIHQGQMKLPMPKRLRQKNEERLIAEAAQEMFMGRKEIKNAHEQKHDSCSDFDVF